MSNNPQTPPKLYTDAEAGELLRCHPETIARLRRRGHLAYTRVGGKVYVTSQHIADYLQRQERPAKTAATSPSPRVHRTQTFTGMMQIDNDALVALAREITAPRKKTRKIPHQSPAVGKASTDD